MAYDEKRPRISKKSLSFKKRCEYKPAVQDFMRYLDVAGRSPSTMESYARSLDRLISALGRNTPLEKISNEQLIKVIADLRSFQMKDTKRSPATMNGIKSAIKSFFKWANETGRCPSNPAAFVRISRFISPRTVPFSAQEIERFLLTIRTSDDKYRFRDEALFAT